MNDAIKDRGLFAAWTNEIGPIFRAAKKQRARTVVIVLEVALSLAIAVNCINLIIDLRRTMARPSGFDEANLMSVTISPFAEEFRGDEAAMKVVRQTDMQLLKDLPGVRAVSMLSAIPLSGGGSSTGRRLPDKEDMEPVRTPYFEVTPEFLDTMGLELVAGRNFGPEDLHAEEGTQNIILTKNLADIFYPNGDALGKQIASRSTKNTIIGIVGHMANSWPDSDLWDRAMLIPDADPGFANFYRFMVAAKPTRLDEVRVRLEQALIEKHPGRLVRVRSMAETRADTFRDSDAVVSVLSLVIVLLVAVTALGIAGLTSFSVTQRTQQIGTRRALGATRADILRLFLVENWVVTSIGLALGVAGCFGLHFLLGQWADTPRLPLPLILGGMAALWLTGLFSAFAPAWRATAIAPVIATRSV